VLTYFQANPITNVCLVVLIGLLLRVCFQDWSVRKISNKWTLACFALGSFYLFFSEAGAGVFSPLSGAASSKYHIIAFGAALFLGFLAYAVKVWGAGDAKLFAALSLWIPYTDLPFFLLTICFFGGLLSVLYIAVSSQKRLIFANLSLLAFAPAALKPSALNQNTGARLPFSLAICGAFAFGCLNGVFSWIGR
jgi:Flp pilus assembly protein protease CpaA